MDLKEPDIHVLDGWMAATKSTPSMHHPRRWNVTTSIVGLKNGHIRTNLTQNGEPQIYSWERRRRSRSDILELLKYSTHISCSQYSSLLFMCCVCSNINWTELLICFQYVIKILFFKRNITFFFLFQPNHSLLKLCLCHHNWALFFCVVHFGRL